MVRMAGMHWHVMHGMQEYKSEPDTDMFPYTATGEVGCSFVSFIIPQLSLACTLTCTLHGIQAEQHQIRLPVYMDCYSSNVVSV